MMISTLVHTPSGLTISHNLIALEIESQVNNEPCITIATLDEIY